LFVAAEAPLVALVYGGGRYSQQWNASYAAAFSYYTTDVSIVITSPEGVDLVQFVGKPAVTAFLTLPNVTPQPQPQTVPRIASVVPSQSYVSIASWFNPIDTRDPCIQDQSVTLYYDWVPVYALTAAGNALQLVDAQNQKVVVVRKCVNNYLNDRYQLQLLQFFNMAILA